MATIPEKYLMKSHKKIIKIMYFYLFYQKLLTNYLEYQRAVLHENLFKWMFLILKYIQTDESVILFASEQPNDGDYIWIYHISLTRMLLSQFVSHYTVLAWLSFDL